MVPPVDAEPLGNIRSGGLADHAARDQSDRTCYDRAGERAHGAVAEPLAGCGRTQHKGRKQGGNGENSHGDTPSNSFIASLSLRG